MCNGVSVVGGDLEDGGSKDSVKEIADHKVS